LEIAQLKREVIKLKAERDILNLWSAPCLQVRSSQRHARSASIYPASL
jgi:hypothetical protein